MGIRRVEQELEARLISPTGAGGSGKLESKRYSDGVQRLKIKAKGLAVLGALEAVVRVGGREIAQLPLERGALRFDHSSRNPAQMPQFSPGDRVEVLVNGVLMLSGELQLD